MGPKILNSSGFGLIDSPAQYLGGERGSVTKADSQVDLNICLAFPDAYEVGMSHLGLQILYDLVNQHSTWWAERAYQPRRDMEALLRREEEPLYSLESGRALKDFDVLGFSLQYELCATGVLAMLDLGGLPIRASDRGEDCPLVIAGGPFCYHPEPLADFIDLFLVGDGEELVPEFLTLLEECKRKSTPKREVLSRAAKLQGIYVPSFFQPKHLEDRNEVQLDPLLESYQGVRRRVLATLEDSPYPTNPVVPNTKIIHDRLSVEVMRGCVRGCRFCQAGYLYRPQRERSPEEIISIVSEGLENTGYEELSLLSLSTADYCSVLPLLYELKEQFAENDQLAISFPSTRVDALTPDILNEVQTVRRTGFTLAPEAGTQRLRDVINKGVSDEQVIETCQNVFKLGWSHIKLYFMLGLPTETDEDLIAIATLAKRVKQLAGRGQGVTVSVSTHIPKPHTPFQWSEQIGIEETKRRQFLIKSNLKGSGINFRYHNPESSFLEGVFARGDRRLGPVLEKAYELGARFDGWEEEFDLELWLKAFRECSLDPEIYLQERDLEAALPWDHISCDIPKDYFAREWRRAVGERTTPDCLTASCSICGTCNYDAKRNVLFDRRRSEERLNIVSPPWTREPAIESATKGKLVVPVVQRIRLEYQKSGRARFVAHLDLTAVFFRAARRSGIPIAYTQGFHPKPKLSFGPPLQLGIESRCEYVDYFFFGETSPNVVVERLNEELPEGISINGAQEIGLKHPSIQASVRRQAFQASSILPIKVCSDWTTKVIEKRRKKRTTQVRLAEFVERVSYRENVLSFELLFDNSHGSLKPGEVVEALTEQSAGAFSIVKTKTWLDDAEELGNYEGSSSLWALSP